MSDDEREIDCKDFSTLFERTESGFALTQSEESALLKHENCCKACKGLSKQHKQITVLASGFPQFDVSEGLTQKILKSVEQESVPTVHTSFYPIGLAASIVILVLVPFDSIQSLLGWASGLLGLAVLQILMKTANAREQVI